MPKYVNTSYEGAAYNELMNIAEGKGYDEFVLLHKRKRLRVEKEHI